MSYRRVMTITRNSVKKQNSSNTFIIILSVKYDFNKKKFAHLI